MTSSTIIAAAGGLLWRPTAGAPELAVVYRRRYSDWSLPKGKVQAGEDWRQAALREVREETGFDAEILGFAGAIAYEVERRVKVVRFWHMRARGEAGAAIDDEVAEVRWLPARLAVERLQYPLEQALVAESEPPRDAAL